MGAGAISRIQILPSALADQIAAGEVVERPASVVKELCENAIDAGARRVEIEIEGGGRRLVRVVDDGSGMTPEEARLALKRHATSKIKSADDLWGLHTFGFRGEALPSIAAVSRLTVQTKMVGDLAGFRLRIEAGEEQEASAVGMPDGTQMEVRDLFFNTPARLKFLKTEATEAGNVSEAILRLALAHPEVHFRLRCNGRSTLDLPGQNAAGERVRAALARRGAGLLHEAQGEENGVQVRAYLAGPDEAAGTPRSTFLFVGQRFVRDRSLLAALCMGYGELLEKGRYPLAALFVQVPGEEVDINVHPQKLEVRFARAQEVYAAVRHVLIAAVARAPWLVSVARRAHTLPPDATPGRAEGRRPPSGFVAEPGHSAPRPTPYPLSLRDERREESPPRRHGGFFSSLDYLGQFQRDYLLCQGKDELVLVDQQAAQERIVLQRLRAAHGTRNISRHQLLFPIPVEVDEGAPGQLPDPAALNDLGFEVEAFGPTTLLVRAVPELLRNGDLKPMVQGVLRSLEAPGRTTDWPDAVLTVMASHSVRQTGDPLGREQALALLAQLDDADPSGPGDRPVLLRLPLGEIERRFGRP